MVSSGDRSAKIRTYNYPQGRIRSPYWSHTYDLQNIVNGDLDKLVDEIQLHYNTEKLKVSGEPI